MILKIRAINTALLKKCPLKIIKKSKKHTVDKITFITGGKEKIVVIKEQMILIINTVINIILLLK